MRHELSSSISRPVLVTAGDNGGARSALAAVRALALAGYRPFVTVSAPLSLAASSRHCCGKVVTGLAADPGYAASVREAARALGDAPILPASDAALTALGSPGREFLGKASLATRATSAGLLTPPTERVENDEDLHRRAGEFPYPIVVKPELSTSPAVRVCEARDLQGIRLQGPAVVQPFLSGPMEAVGGFLRGGRLLAVVHQRYLRTWPVDCGTSSAAVTVVGDPERERRLVGLLGGYEGIFQVQFRDGHVLDVNPRVYGSLPLAVAAGVNLATLQVDLLLGKPGPRDVLRGKPGVRYRWLDGDLRHAASLARDGRLLQALTAILPRPGTVHSICTWKDPMPGWARARMMLRKAL